MKKSSILLGAICVAPLSVMAENPRMEHVLVTVPVHKKQAATAIPVTVLSGDELRRQAAATIGETLEGAPGLASASFGPGVGQPVIRGQQGPRVQVLQNGVRSFDASSVSADHTVAVEPLLADSVEVLRGPATLLYGGGAIGGVVNVIDNRIPSRLPQAFSGALELRHDTASDGNTAVLRGDGSIGSLAWHIDGVDRRWNDIEIPGLAFNKRTVEDLDESSDGFLRNSDGELQTWTAGGSIHFARGYWGLAVNRMDQEYGIPPGGHAHAEEEGEEEHGEIRIDAEQTRVDSELVLGDPLRGLEQLRWRLTYSEYEHGEIEPSGEVGTLFSNDAWASRLEMVHTQTGPWHGAFGLQLARSDFAAVGEESFIPRAETTSVGLFLLEDYHAPGWTLEAGLRWDWDGVEPDDSRFREKRFSSASGSLALLKPLGGHWTAGLALSQSRRAPVTEELFSNVGNTAPELVEHGATGVIEIGDAGLDQEVSNNVDVTLSWDYPLTHGFATLFYNDFRDYIFLQDTETTQDEVEIFAYRQRDADFHGVEFELNRVLLGDRDQGVNLRIFGDAIDGELDGGENVPRLPPYRIGAGLAYVIGGFEADLSWLHAGRQDDPGAHESETPGYDRVDVGISYRWAVKALEYQLFVRGKNLGDEEIRSSTSLLRDFAPEPGRSVEAGVRFVY